ncbi:MAG: PorP/SprF family type IX secretion system membrane protein [Bacteroidota bacterium]
MIGLRLLPFLFLATTYMLQAQQLSLFTQYRENAAIINPAALESDFLAFGHNATIGVSYRAQWVGLSGAPTTQTLRGSYLNTEWSGVTLMAGGHLINDQTGPTGFTGLYGRVAAILTNDVQVGGLILGLSAGFVQYRVNASEILLQDPNDVLGTVDQTQGYPDIGAGLYFYQTIGGPRGEDYFYAGVSVPQVFGLDLAFQNDAGEYNIQRVQHIYGMLGMYKFFDNGGFLEPSVWVKSVSGAPINADVNLRYQMPSALWIGAGGATSGTAHLEGGLTIGEDAGFTNTLRIGYGFDYSFSSFGPAAGSTHEVNLSFSFGGY